MAGFVYLEQPRLVWPTRVLSAEAGCFEGSTGREGRASRTSTTGGETRQAATAPVG